MKAITKSLRSVLDRARQSPAYTVEGAKLEFTEQIVALMETGGVSKTALAARLGVAPAYVTKVLSGTTNFTLESMVKIARALGGELRLQLKPANQNPELASKTSLRAVHPNGNSPRRSGQTRPPTRRAA